MTRNAHSFQCLERFETVHSGWPMGLTFIVLREGQLIVTIVVMGLGVERGEAKTMG